MIGQALQIMLFGMLGIFVVMGLIILTISLLKRFTGKNESKSENESS